MCGSKLHGYTVHQTMLKPFYYQLMHIMLKNTELLKHSNSIPSHSARHTRLTGHNMQP